MENISKHISYSEAIRSDVAKRKGISNIPNCDQLENMKEVATFIFEPIRSYFGVPIFISSMFRSAELNKAIGGAHRYERGVYIPLSQHCSGQAMDIDADVFGSVTNEEIFSYILENLIYDQCIAEGVENGHVEWVHVSFNQDNNRKQPLIMYREEGKSKYLPYTEENYNKFIKQ